MKNVASTGDTEWPFSTFQVASIATETQCSGAKTHRKMTSSPKMGEGAPTRACIPEGAQIILSV